VFVLRLLALLVAAAIGIGLLAYVLTGQRSYLRLAWRLFRYALVFALLVFGLLLFERLAVLTL
jgi:hypothetical protein